MAPPSLNFTYLMGKAVLGVLQRLKAEPGPFSTFELAEIGGFGLDFSGIEVRVHNDHGLIQDIHVELGLPEFGLKGLDVLFQLLGRIQGL